MDRDAKEDKAPKTKPKKMKRPRRVRNRPDAILIKVGQDKEWVTIERWLQKEGEHQGVEERRRTFSLKSKKGETGCKYIKG